MPPLKKNSIHMKVTWYHIDLQRQTVSSKCLVAWLYKMVFKIQASCAQKWHEAQDMQYITL